MGRQSETSSARRASSIQPGASAPGESAGERVSGSQTNPPPAAELTTREAAKQETRRALIEAGLMEFVEHGLDVPSLDAICARAGYTRGAFYVHFRDREELVVAVMESILTTFFDAVIATGEAATDLEETIRRFAAALTDGSIPWCHPGSVRVYHLLDVCTRSPVIRSRFIQMIEEARARVARVARQGQTARTVRADIPAEDIAQLLIALATGLISMVDAGVPIDVPALRRTVLALLHGGADGRQRH